MSCILSIDTSSDSCSVALLVNEQVTSECIESPRQHSQQLLPLVDKVLKSQKLDLQDLDAIAYGRGPGSFTGLRICLGVVQGLAYSNDIPIIPVSTLQAMAQGALRRGYLKLGEKVLTALDARMNEVYWSLYQVGTNTNTSAMETISITDEFVSSPASVLENRILQEIPSQQLLMIGPGCHYPELFQYPAREKVEAFIPRAEDMLVLAREAFIQGIHINAEDAQPVYLRDSVAWKKRQRIRTI